ncbi:MAG TPA: hypothetical protein EYG73_01900 [Arcobacter sp.]|nr:hypothetical protein [Arcobacter sp.]
MQIEELKIKLQNFKDNQQQQKLRGLNNYNIMGVLRKLHAEVGMHSNFIYSLLDINGEHYQGDLFANLFIKFVLKINDFGEITKVEMEENADGRRIDFTIKSDKYFIGIEMKIYANDESNQISDYYKFLDDEASKLKSKPEVKIYYLTLNKKEASLKSHQNRPYTKIAFNNEILRWLEQSQKQVSNITNLNNAIGYYTDVINMLIGKYKSPIKQYKDFFLNQDIYEVYEKNKTKILKYFEDDASSIEDGFKKAKQKLHDEFYIYLIKELLNENSNLQYFRYIENTSLQEIQLVLNEYYGLNISLNKQLDKFISLKMGIAWAYHNEAKGNPELKILLQQKGKELSKNENIKVYMQNKGENLNKSMIISQPTTENLFLAQKNKLEKLNDDIVYEIQKHINIIKEVLEN